MLQPLAKIRSRATRRWLVGSKSVQEIDWFITVVKMPSGLGKTIPENTRSKNMTKLETRKLRGVVLSKFQGSYLKCNVYISNSDGQTSGSLGLSLSLSLSLSKFEFET